MKMKVVTLCLIIICCAVLVGFDQCDGSNVKSALVKVHEKDGESCLVEHKCKLTVRRWEGGDSMGGGYNVYYRCWVTNDFYELAGKEDTIKLDLNKCASVPAQ